MLFSLIALSTAGASQINASLLKWYPPEKLATRAVLVSVAACIVILVCVFAGVGGVAGLVAGLFVLIATLGFIIGNTMAAAISSAGAHAGAASALVGVMQFLFGTLGSATVGVLADPTGRVMGTVLGILSVVSLLVVLRVARPLPAAMVAREGGAL
jgi:DHA1 family bicyclomycin/chloramphenicol resistance-like MFS transporter